jgi:hypothetical protein
MLATATKPALTVLSKGSSLLRLQAGRYVAFISKYFTMNNQDLNESEKFFQPMDDEMKEIHENFKITEREGVNNILKYFDRIHDKLFNFNNILIVGYFALSKIDPTVSMKNILFPFCNLIILVYIEYRMMEKSRFEAKITERPYVKITSHGKRIVMTTLFSLLSICATFIVTLIFLYYLFR